MVKLLKIKRRGFLSAYCSLRNEMERNETKCSLRSKRFRAVKEQRTRNESQRPREKWRKWKSGEGVGKKGRKERRFNGHRKWTFCILGQIFRQIISIRVMTLINTNVVASRHILNKRRGLASACWLLSLGVTHFAQSEFSGRNGFFGGNFLFRISE